MTVFGFLNLRVTDVTFSLFGKNVYVLFFSYSQNLLKFLLFTSKLILLIFDILILQFLAFIASFKDIHILF